MKIAHVVDSMEVGGAETLVYQMCQLQREQGHDPFVYAVAALGSLGERMRADGFSVQPHVGRHLADSMQTFYRIFLETRPDVVHLHNARPTTYAAPSAKLAGVRRIVSTRHGLVEPPHRVIAESKYAMAALCCNWVVGICDATVNNLKSLHTMPARKIVRIYNGVAPVEHIPSQQWPRKDGFTLLFVGRLAPVKNLSLLLNALRAALVSRRDLRLWLVGDGSERLPLERLSQELGIAREVTFFGQQLEVAPFFSAADTFVMSSQSEGLPLSLLQAFSAGLPAIVTDVGGMAEAVRLINAGVAVPSDDSVAMAAAILDLADNSSNRLAFARSAELGFHSEFSLTRMVDAYERFYRNKTTVAPFQP